MANKSKLQFGKANLLPEEILPRDESVRISIVMEGDLLDAIKAQAREAGKPYQRVMKEALRQHFIGPVIDGELIRTIRKIVRDELKKKDPVV